MQQMWFIMETIFSPKDDRDRSSQSITLTGANYKTAFSTTHEGNSHQLHQLLAQCNPVTPLLMPHSLHLRNNAFLLALLTILMETKIISQLLLPLIDTYDSEPKSGTTKTQPAEYG